MIVFTSLLWIWKSEATAARWHFLTIPEELCAEIRARSLASRRGFGSVKVEARIEGTVWQTSVFPLNSGGYLLPVKHDVRRTVGLAVGDEVTVRLLLV